MRRGRWLPWAVLLGDLAIAAIVLGILSLMLWVQLTLIPQALFGEYDGIVTGVASWAFMGAFELVGAFIVFAITCALVFLLGLPVRLIRPIRRLWLANGEVTLALVLLGGVGIGIAYLLGSWSVYPMEQGSYPIYTPQLWILLISWLVLAFAVAHVVWPMRWLPRRARAWWHQAIDKPPRVAAS